MSVPDPPLALGDTIYVAIAGRIALREVLPTGILQQVVARGQVIGTDIAGAPYVNIPITGATFMPTAEDEGRAWARGEEDSPDVEALKTVIMLGGDGT